IPGVQDVSLTWQSPLNGGSNQTFNYKGKPVSFQEFAVDSSFFNVFDIKMDLTDVAHSENGVYLNETAIDALELGENPISFTMGEEEKPIFGVMKDFNFKELREKIGPLMIRRIGDTYVTDVFIKVGGNSVFQTLDHIKT